MAGYSKSRDVDVSREIANIYQAVRMARRELRSGLQGFGVFLTCLFLGVFAITAIGSFTESAKSGLLADAGALLGGDLEIRMAHRELPEETQEFLKQYGQLSHVVTTRTMVVNPIENKRLLVELKAVDSAYPLYGKIESNPPQEIVNALTGDNTYGAIVESQMLNRIGVKIGDKVKLGSAEIQITGVITREPDRKIRAFNLGPRIMISMNGLVATELIKPGSLIYHAYRLRLPDRETADALKGTLKTRYPDAGWRLRTWREAAPRVQFFLDRMNQNLTLIGLCALLVGGLGVAGAVRGYLTSKINHIATMKCLGSSSRLVFITYLLQILFLGAIGAFLGIFCGSLLPYLLMQFFGNQIPIPLEPNIHWRVVLTAAVFGLLIALIFSLKALGSATRVSPSVLFRGYSEGQVQNPGFRVKVMMAVAIVALALLAILTSSDQIMAFWFVCGAALCFAVFRFSATAVVNFATRLPRARRPSLRLGISSIHRKGSPAGSALFSMGLGLTSLVIVMLVQSNLDDKINETVPSEAPAFFFLDIQPHQVESFQAEVHTLPGLKKFELYPTLRGRITAIDGVPVEQANIAQNVQWAVRGDRFLSYSDRMPNDTVLVAGEWWPQNYNGATLVSITSDLAEGFGVSIGDTLAVNVLGRDVTAQISSLRQVDWSTLDLNFALIFSPGFLDKAPHTNVASVHINFEHEESYFSAITNTFPNVSIISTREIMKNVTNTLARIGIAFRGMAAVALLTGILVLSGAISADQHRRIHDAVIFKVCGAARVDILGAFAAEFTLLGLIAGIMSSIVGSLAAMGIVRGLMNMTFILHPGTVFFTVLLGTGLTLLLGLIGTWRALGQKPATYLRIK